jgi:hypothetical protein
MQRLEDAGQSFRGWRGAAAEHAWIEQRREREAAQAIRRTRQEGAAIDAFLKQPLMEGKIHDSCLAILIQKDHHERHEKHEIRRDVLAEQTINQAHRVVR